MEKSVQELISKQLKVKWAKVSHDVSLAIPAKISDEESNIILGYLIENGIRNFSYKVSGPAEFTFANLLKKARGEKAASTKVELSADEKKIYKLLVGKCKAWKLAGRLEKEIAKFGSLATVAEKLWTNKKFGNAALPAPETFAVLVARLEKAIDKVTVAEDDTEELD
jgi:hypothetical protein